jgi:hypothetical protein
MEDLDQLVKPTNCFCQFPKTELKKWAKQRYVEHHSTIELLNEASSIHDKEVISAVALIDIDEASMVKMMGNVDLPEHHIVHCRLQAKQMIEELQKENKR